MKIDITFEDDGSEDLIYRHMAERAGEWCVSEWVWGLVCDSIEQHPDYRECADRVECCELIHPVMTVQQCASKTRRKHTVTSRPAEVCPACGGPVVKPTLKAWDPTPATATA